MATEFERKFLVRDQSVLIGSVGIRYQQGYLSTDPERTVRVRRAGDHAFLTIKGISRGAARAEFEYEIPVADAGELLTLCPGSGIAKMRYRLDHAGRTWEIDVFEGDNAGLVVAEVEIPSEDAVVALPDWVGDEVTADPRYYNANLTSHPFSAWGPPAE